MLENTYEYRINQLSKEELAQLARRQIQEIDQLKDRMIDKSEAAKRLGMTVSWIDNSQSEKATKLRRTAVRYGRSRTSPVRFPLSEVLKLCREDEGLAYD